jgi:sugar phosphate isomerase/epimerase
MKTQHGRIAIEFISVLGLPPVPFIELAALHPTLIGYVQLCDVPLVSKYDDYSYEARFDRLAPGKGELPLLELLAAVPRDVIVGLETPMLREAQTGVGPKERLSGGIQATRNLLARAMALMDGSRAGNAA